MKLHIPFLGEGNEVIPGARLPTPRTEFFPNADSRDRAAEFLATIPEIPVPALGAGYDSMEGRPHPLSVAAMEEAGRRDTNQFRTYHMGSAQPQPPVTGVVLDEVPEYARQIKPRPPEHPGVVTRPRPGELRPIPRIVYQVQGPGWPLVVLALVVGIAVGTLVLLLPGG